MPYFPDAPIEQDAVWKISTSPMTTNIERERKLRAPNGFSLARLPRELKGYTASPARFKRQHTTYYDTADFRLMRWGCSLRYRRNEGWTLKIPVCGGDGAEGREEHAFEGPRDSIPSEALQLTMGYTRRKPLVRIAELRTLRVVREFHDRHGDDVAEVAQDDVRVVDGSRVTKRFAQIEIELEEHTARSALDDIGSVLRRAGAGGTDQTPKNVVALGRDISAEVAIPHVNARATVVNVFRAALAKSVVTLMHSDAPLRVTNDPEAVHRARVAVRRLRSYLHTFLPALQPEWACALGERLRWLQDKLARVRDGDVLANLVADLADRLTPVDADEGQAIAADCKREVQAYREALRDALNEDRYFALLDELLEASRDPKTNDKAEKRAAKYGRALIDRVYKKAQKAVKRAGAQPSDRALHRIRIKSKHVRYAAEVFACVLGARGEKLATAAESLQSQLGDHHDTVLAVRRLREERPPRSFVAGELTVLATQRGSAACSNWRQSWHRISQKLIN